MNRRKFITASAVAPIAGVAGAGIVDPYNLGQADMVESLKTRGRELIEVRQVDPHGAWFEQWKVHRGLWLEAAQGDDEGHDHEAKNAATREADRLSDQIANTVPQTKEGILKQLEYWIADFGQNSLGDTSLPECATILSMQEGIRQLSI